MTASGKHRPMGARELVLLALLGALLLVTKLALAWLPNIEPVSLLVLVYTAVLGWKALAPVYVYVMMEILIWGLGFWTRANPELCLIATKGQPKRVSKAVHCIVDTPVEVHSKKPDIVREKIVELAGDLPRAELFARNEYPGWVCVGNEIDGMDIRDSLRLLKER